MHFRGVIWKMKSKSNFPVSFNLISAKPMHSQATVLDLLIHNGEEKVANDIEKSKCLSNFQEREQTIC